MHVSKRCMTFKNIDTHKDSILICIIIFRKKHVFIPSEINSYVYIKNKSAHKQVAILQQDIATVAQEDCGSAQGSFAFFTSTTLIIVSIVERCMRPSRKSNNRDWLILFAVVMFSDRVNAL